MDQRRVTIRFCVNNPRSPAEREDLIARGAECRDCLSNCERCFETRYLEIDGDFIEGASYDEIRAHGAGRSDTA